MSKGSENLHKKLNDTRTLAIISKIQSQQKNTIIAYGILVFILNFIIVKNSSYLILYYIFL